MKFIISCPYWSVLWSSGQVIASWPYWSVPWSSGQINTTCITLKETSQAVHTDLFFEAVDKLFASCPYYSTKWWMNSNAIIRRLNSPLRIISNNFYLSNHLQQFHLKQRTSVTLFQVVQGQHSGVASQKVGQNEYIPTTFMITNRPVGKEVFNCKRLTTEYCPLSLLPNPNRRCPGSINKISIIAYLLKRSVRCTIHAMLKTI